MWSGVSGYVSGCGCEQIRCMQHNSVEVVVTIPVVVAVVILGMAVVLVVVEVATAAAHNKIMCFFFKVANKNSLR